MVKNYKLLIEPLGYSEVIRPEGWRALMSRRKKNISKNKIRL